MTGKLLTLALVALLGQNIGEKTEDEVVKTMEEFYAAVKK